MAAEPTASARAVRRRGWRTAISSVLVYAAAIALWQALVDMRGIPAYVLPSPSAILQAMAADNGSLFCHAAITLSEAVAGFIIGSALGALLGIVLAYSQLAAWTLLPLLVAANAIPVVAIAPILILWFGYGIGSKVAVTAFLSFFSLAISMMRGLNSADRIHRDVFRVTAATGWQTFLKLRLPSAMPYVFVGLKLNATFAVIGAIVAEFVQADRGLGFVIMSSYRTLAMPRLWAAMVASALIGVSFYGLIVLLERLILRWKP